MTDRERALCAQALEATRANMLGTDDEQHYWDCHEAARLLREAPSADDLVELRELKKLNAEYYDELQRLRSSSPPAPEPCCGEYAACNRPCTPRGRWLGSREDSPKGEPVAWMVWDTKDNEPVEIFGYEQVCHEHINDALANEDSADMAKSWTVRPVHTSPPEGQQAAEWNAEAFVRSVMQSAADWVTEARMGDYANACGSSLRTENILRRHFGLPLAPLAAPTPIAGDEGKEVE